MKYAVRLLKSCLYVAAAVVLVPALTFAQKYVQTNLDTDLATGAKFTNDGNLLNPWGLTRSTTGPWWVSDNNAGVSTVYDSTGAKHLTVTIPGPNGTFPCTTTNPPTPTGCFVAAPTGIVYNGTASFEVTPNGKPAEFIFDTEDGTISAWAGGAAATLEVDNSANPTAADGAVYKGLTIGEFHGNVYLYATNFRAGKVEVYDTNFKQIFRLDDDDRYTDHWDADHADDSGFFEDKSIPKGFAPFGIQNIGGSIFVTYAKQNAAKHDDIAGSGNGFVDVYSTGGKFLTRFEPGPWLNSPWGVVWTPRDFGEFSNNILVGNFGSGQIAAYDGFTGKFKGLMKDETGKPLSINGLWSLTFGNGASAGPFNSLFFTAGINDENDGLFGTLTPDPAELSEADEL
jgi:uncharacterized protein (TIGR03118 family)